MSREGSILETPNRHKAWSFREGTHSVWEEGIPAYSLSRHSIQNTCISGNSDERVSASGKRSVWGPSHSGSRWAAWGRVARPQFVPWGARHSESGGLTLHSQHHASSRCPVRCTMDRLGKTYLGYLEPVGCRVSGPLPRPKGRR